MIIQPQKAPFEHLIIDDVYTEDELKLIWSEIDFLTPNLLTPEGSGSAAVETDGGVTYRKRGSSIFVDSVFSNRKFSNILTLNRKIFEPEIIKAAKELHPFMGFMEYSNFDVTLLNRYENGDYYKPHTDLCVLSAITFFIDDAGFSGGEFQFSDYGHSVEQKNNRTIIFPGLIKHSVDEVVLNENSKGRYSMAQFLSMNYK